MCRSFNDLSRACSRLPVQAEHEAEEESALAVNLFKLRAMFHRVQQLLLPRHNRNRAKRADSESMACSGSPVRRGEKPNGESLRGTTGTETTSACVFLFYVFFFLFLPFRLFTSPSLRVCLNEPPP